MRIWSRRAGSVFSYGTVADDRMMPIESPGPIKRSSARVVQRGLGVQDVEFVIGDLEAMDMAALGSFDAVFCTALACSTTSRARGTCCGGSLRSDRIYVRTQCANEAVSGHEAGGYAGRGYDEWGRSEPLSGLSPTSFWPTRDELVRMLADAGFAHVHVFGEERVPRRGPAVMLADASRVELMAVNSAASLDERPAKPVLDQVELILRRRQVMLADMNRAWFSHRPSVHARVLPPAHAGDRTRRHRSLTARERGADPRGFDRSTIAAVSARGCDARRGLEIHAERS